MLQLSPGRRGGDETKSGGRGDARADGSRRGTTRRATHPRSRKAGTAPVADRAGVHEARAAGRCGTRTRRLSNSSLGNVKRPAIASVGMGSPDARERGLRRSAAPGGHGRRPPRGPTNGREKRSAIRRPRDRRRRRVRCFHGCDGGGGRPTHCIAGSSRHSCLHPACSGQRVQWATYRRAGPGTAVAAACQASSCTSSARPVSGHATVRASRNRK